MIVSFIIFYLLKNITLEIFKMKIENQILNIQQLDDESESSQSRKNNEIQKILHNNVRSAEEDFQRCISHSEETNNNRTSNQQQQITTDKQHPGVSRITNNLLLCSAAVLRPDVLVRLGVTCVINATSELPDTPLPSPPVTPAYLRIPVWDKNEADLGEYFDLVADTIEQVRLSNGVTLVHCVAGVSRSASLCLAYLIKHEQMTLRKAYEMVKQKRPQIKPNCGFFRQLIEYERRFFPENSVRFVYNQVTETDIPDVYECDYEHMLLFQKKYNVTLGRR